MNDLPDTNSPSWIGLPTTAETQLQIIAGQKTLSKLTVLQGLADDIKEDDSDLMSNDNGAANGQGKLKAVLFDKLTRWLAMLSQSISQPLFGMDVSSLDANAKAIERCILREVLKGKHVVALVSDDLAHLRSVN